MKPIHNGNTEGPYRFILGLKHQEQKADDKAPFFFILTGVVGFRTDASSAKMTRSNSLQEISFLISGDISGIGTSLDCRQLLAIGRLQSHLSDTQAVLSVRRDGIPHTVVGDPVSALINLKVICLEDVFFASCCLIHNSMALD